MTDINTVSDPTLHVALHLTRAHNTLARRLDRVLGAHFGISFSDFALMQALADAPGGQMRPVDLSAAVALTPSGVTRALLPLEKIGLVQRTADPRDGRVSRASLTTAGQARLAEAQAIAGEATARLLSFLDPARLVETDRVLRQVASLAG